MQKDKMEAIINWPIFKNVKDVKVFLEYFNFYKQYIKTYSGICILLIILI